MGSHMGIDDEKGEGWEEDVDDSEEVELVTFVDENGVEATFAILMVVEFEGSDYAVLAPVAELDDETIAEVELMISTYSENEDGEPEFGDIDDDALYERLQAFCADILENDDDGEGEGEGEGEQ